MQHYRPAPYAEKLQFEVSTEEKYDTDRLMIADEMIEQGIEKIKDTVNPNQNPNYH